MTTWHSEEPLDEALFFLLYSAVPASSFAESTSCSLAVSVGNEKWASRTREVLSSPDWAPGEARQ